MSEANAAAKRRITAWLVYQGDSDLQLMKSLAGTLDVLSVHGDEEPKTTATFVRGTQELGIPVLRLVDHRAGPFDTEAEARKTADGLLASCLDMGYDGIDLDYEHLPVAQRPGYSRLMELARERLHGAGKILSICVGYYPATHRRPPDHAFIDPEVVARCCDEVRVMCYDQNFAPARCQEPFDRLDCQSFGATSTQPWANVVMRHWHGYVPTEKLVMGLPAYSNDYSALPGGFGQHVYADVPPLGRFQMDKAWVWYDQVNLYRYIDQNGKPRLFYASDADSTAAHLRTTATEMGIPAISFWHTRSVSPEMWAVARAWRDGTLA